LRSRKVTVPSAPVDAVPFQIVVPSVRSMDTEALSTEAPKLSTTLMVTRRFLSLFFPPERA
jgi:hypothetical protein